MNSLSSAVSTIQSNFHHLIMKRCDFLSDEEKNSELPNLTLYFESLIKVIKNNPDKTSVKFGEEEEDTLTCITIPSLAKYFGIPGMYGGFTIEFQKQIDKEQMKLINIEELCQCNICLLLKGHQFIDSPIIDLDEFKKWSLITSSWSRMSGGSGKTHKINSDGYALIDEGFV
ncbi:unnamed protein product [Rotaria sp. Silwood1]|nr:unnamed protein product [Rotaria sp. Silwood1]CAF1630832.1 unnamed protein product [Rotaria sp. Silwood1]CAF3744635.1 unnamed protein product [Rotaria sp. Silwood1]CAF3790017.1 unnamed protein product [Rotaria sp. Silwood1]CAF3793356.1 unnamed protein product [Rotaria sp. Silwood1]